MSLIYADELGEQMFNLTCANKYCVCIAETVFEYFCGPQAAAEDELGEQATSLLTNTAINHCAVPRRCLSTLWTPSSDSG